jgi:serine/threonine-protein kinase
MLSPEPPAASEPVIAERYRLIKKLGEGAMGAVYLAEHVHMRKRFALKLLLPEAMASAEIVARFEREAIAAGNIAHPGVCAATDFGRLPDGSFFLVLEYVDGESLRHLVQRGPLPPQRAVGIARQILLALGAAHAKGVVHRDIKPENVMLAANDRGEDVVKVLDFGIAKIDANSLGEGGGTALTRMGAIYGTPNYMAPEQAMGKAVDQRVDLYAVGIMLHEMIAGAPPFEGEGVVILAKHVNEPPPPLQGVSDELRVFVQRLLAKNPDERPESAQQAVAELDQLRASLVSFNGTFAGSSSPLASAATIAGEPSPSPPPVVTTQDPAGKPYAFLAPVAKRLGIGARDLAVVLGVLSGILLVVILFFALRPSKVADDDEPRRAKKTHATPSPEDKAAVAAKEKEKEKEKAQEKEKEPAPKPSSTTSSSSSGGKGGQGGLKGLGKKIKGLF